MRTIKPYPTQERIRELFDYRDDGFLIRKFPAHCKNGEVGTVAGYIDMTYGYMRTHVDNKLCQVHLLIWIYHFGGIPKGKLIDHEDRNPLNNKITNLRFASKSQNAANSGIKPKNTSGFKGVSFEKKLSKWKVQIMDNGKKKHLGIRDNKIDAARLYDLHAKNIFGEFAYLNNV